MKLNKIEQKNYQKLVKKKSKTVIPKYSLTTEKITKPTFKEQVELKDTTIQKLQQIVYDKYLEVKEIAKAVVYEYPTKNKEGFTEEELIRLIAMFPSINRAKFGRNMLGNTCMLKRNKVIHYHCDVHNAILCGLENRDLNLTEWD